ncbi:MAG TPA: SufD family Fe-S cluster assembly protein [Candidatus Saccharimonadales bacterium]|nr:SufD family Fe-S cluster assembly protein [Candidatus Saccharimonadales bacterium]
MKNINLTLQENQEKVLPLVWTTGSEEIVVNATLSGRGARLNVVGAFFLANSDEVKATINITHSAANTYSNTLIKSVLTEQARGGFYGLVKINHGAKNTDTYFREDALLLSKEAKAEAIPSLEIDENEVKAGHASTVGPVDPEQIFYLTSRGVAVEEAKRMIVAGYFHSVMGLLPEKEKEKLTTFVEKKFKID